MTIQIFGAGCTRCKKLEENARQALKNKGIHAEIEKINDVNKIMEYGVIITPALAIDGLLKSSGKVLSVKEIESFF